MIHIGYSIRQANDILRPIDLPELARRIREPDSKFVAYIQHLRAVLAIDPKSYRELKTRLPYVVAATFNPPYRRIEHFASSTEMIIDLDHLQAKNIDLGYLRKKINADPRVVLSFSSPSGDGLKVIFRFAPPFTDAAKYSVFYKIFAHRLAGELNVHQVIDRTTSDVSRACFVSYDPEVYFNPDAAVVETSQYVDFENELSLADLLEQTSSRSEQNTQAKAQVADQRSLSAQDLPNEILQQIKDRLNPALVQRREKKIFVPGELDQIIPQLQQELVKHGLQIESVKNIHYGKQLKIAHGVFWGEINLFYGKRGFSVVKSTKSGSDERITEAASIVVNNFFNSESKET